MRHHMSSVRGLLGVMVLVWVSGCCNMTPRAWNVTVTLDEGSWNSAGGGVIPSLEVDLVGIHPNEKANWENYSVSKYFSPGNALRRDADRVTQTFTNEDRAAKTLSKKDPVWKDKWLGKKGKGAEWLVVLVNLPSSEAGSSGPDPRMQILPLPCKEWAKGVKTLELDVKSSTLICKTPLRPKKK